MFIIHYYCVVVFFYISSCIFQYIFLFIEFSQSNGMMTLSAEQRNVRASCVQWTIRFCRLINRACARLFILFFQIYFSYSAEPLGFSLNYLFFFFLNHGYCHSNIRLCMGMVCVSTSRCRDVVHSARWGRHCGDSLSTISCPWLTQTQLTQTELCHWIFSCICQYQQWLSDLRLNESLHMYSRVE